MEAGKSKAHHFFGNADFYANSRYTLGQSNKTAKPAYRSIVQ